MSAALSKLIPRGPCGTSSSAMSTPRLRVYGNLRRRRAGIRHGAGPGPGDKALAHGRLQRRVHAHEIEVFGEPQAIDGQADDRGHYRIEPILLITAWRQCGRFAPALPPGAPGNWPAPP